MIPLVSPYVVKVVYCINDSLTPVHSSHGAVDEVGMIGWSSGEDVYFNEGWIEETKNIVDKASHFLSKDKILLTERGSSFGYNNLVVDMASFQIMKSFGVRAIHDATHCVQRPGGLGTATGGKREQILVLARAAVAAGADGIFMECHPNPDKALSDAATALPLTQVKSIVEQLLKIRRAVEV